MMRISVLMYRDLYSRKAFSVEKEIIWVVPIDGGIGDYMRVIIIATGIDIPCYHNQRAHLIHRGWSFC